MTWPETFRADFEYRTIVLAPTGSDAALTVDFLSAAKIAAEVAATVVELNDKILAGCGAVIVAEEVLSPTVVARFFGLLQQQPAWSDVPVILITTGGMAGGERIRRLTAYGSSGNVSVLERPFRPATLVTVVEAALRARRRQYQARQLLTDLDQAREVAERANRAKDDFLAALSHELRTPLNPVLLLVTEYAADESLSPALRRDFDLIARNVTLEARLIDDLLDLTRITRGKLSLELRALDAHTAVHEALATTQAEITEKKLTVALDLQATETTVTADAVRLQQILWNVLKNAAKFTPVGGRIGIETFNETGDFVVRITDTGVGMESAEVERVFEAFTQGDHARPESRHRFGGLGLGLAICRMLVTAHGGTITAASDGLGRGASFVLRLPVSAMLAAASPVRPAAAPKSNSIGAASRVLLVEDHQGTRLSLGRLLERRGFRVISASSLAEARNLLKKNAFDLLISDIGLPDGSGYELMTSLRETGLKGIALSGYGMESDIALSQEAGFIQHLIKPVNVQALDAALEACRPPAG